MIKIDFILKSSRPPFSFLIAALGLCVVTQFMHKAHQLWEKGTCAFLTALTSCWVSTEITSCRTPCYWKQDLTFSPCLVTSSAVFSWKHPNWSDYLIGYLLLWSPTRLLFKYNSYRVLVMLRIAGKSALLPLGTPQGKPMFLFSREKELRGLNPISASFQLCNLGQVLTTLEISVLIRNMKPISRTYSSSWGTEWTTADKAPSPGPGVRGECRPPCAIISVPPLRGCESVQRFWVAGRPTSSC